MGETFASALPRRELVLDPIMAVVAVVVTAGMVVSMDRAAIERVFGRKESGL